MAQQSRYKPFAPMARPQVRMSSHCARAMCEDRRSTVGISGELWVVCVTRFICFCAYLAPVRSQRSLANAQTLQEQLVPCTWLKPRGKKGAWRKGSWTFLGFHMVAELPGAATAKAMARSERNETGEVFEEAHGGLSDAGELMAGGQVPLVSGQSGPVPFSQLFGPGGMHQAMPFLPLSGPMHGNSSVYGAMMSPCGHGVPMSPAFGGVGGASWAQAPPRCPPRRPRCPRCPPRGPPRATG